MQIELSINRKVCFGLFAPITGKLQIPTCKIFHFTLGEFHVLHLQ